MRIEELRLGICIANHADAGVSFELWEFIFELGAEVGAFKTVNRTLESKFGIISHHTGTTCAEV